MVSKVGLASMTIVLTVCLRMQGRRSRRGAEGGLSDGRDGLSFLRILDSYVLHYIWFDHCSALFNHMKSLLVLANLVNSLLLISQYASTNHTDSSVSVGPPNHNNTHRNVVLCLEFEFELFNGAWASGPTSPAASNP